MSEVGMLPPVGVWATWRGPPRARAMRAMAKRSRWVEVLAVIVTDDRLREHATEIVRGDRSGGASTSQTIMVSSLSALVQLLPPDAPAGCYRAAVIDENVLGKRTAGAREWAFRQLRRFYVLDPASLLFRALRDLWPDPEPEGLACFEAGKEYEHGGVSPQECIVPRLTVTASAATAATGGPEITKVTWLGLLCRIELSGVGHGVVADLRGLSADPRTSIAAKAKETTAPGRVSLTVSDEDLEGQRAHLVLVGPDGEILADRDVVVGRNR